MKTFSKTPGPEHRQAADCPACGGREKKIFGETDGAVFIRCGTCGSLYQDPRPDQVDLSERYDEEYFRYEMANEENFYRLMRLGLKDIGFSDLSSQFGDRRRFLDVGCATGRLIEALAAEGWRTCGVELCGPSVEFGRRERHLDIILGTLEDASFPAESFHVVHASHLIEHLTDPRGFIREIHRILQPGGYCILTTPNAAGFQARLFRRGWRSVIPDHICLFSRRSLSGLIESEGFELVRRKTWGGLGEGTAPRWIKRPADRLAKAFGWGDVMILLCRKRYHASGY